MGASTWFLIALVAVLLGAALLIAERLRGRGGGSARDRKRWAAARGWDWQDADPVLPGRWRYGTISQGGPGVARNVASGSVPTPDGDRQGHLFDHEQAGRVGSVVAAVQVRTPLPAAMELRLPSAPEPEGAGLDLVERVGERYAFVADPEAARPFMTSRLAVAADAVGDDIEVLWAEDTWVLAVAPLGSDQDRLQNLLADLAEVATVLEQGKAARHAGR